MLPHNMFRLFEKYNCKINCCPTCSGSIDDFDTNWTILKYSDESEYDRTRSYIMKQHLNQTECLKNFVKKYNEITKMCKQTIENDYKNYVKHLTDYKKLNFKLILSIYSNIKIIEINGRKILVSFEEKLNLSTTEKDDTKNGLKIIKTIINILIE